MTGIFESVLIDSIVVGERQRGTNNYGDLEELADDIAARGLLHPVIITRDRELVAGHRRLQACKLLGRTHILAHFFEDLTPREQLAIEFVENEKRKDFEYPERVKAIARYHELCVQEEGLGWTHEDTAKALGLKRRTVDQHIQVHGEVERGTIDPKIVKTFGAARNQAIRIRARRAEDEFSTTVQGTLYTLTDSILTADFNQWARTYDGFPFNLLHCDFPYGIGSDQFGQGARHLGVYGDSPAGYRQLCDTLRDNIDRICAPSAHIIFWFHPTFYCETWQFLNALPGFKFDEYPLTWTKSDNAGIIPDPQRRPRRIYEMAFFGWRGDRMLAPAGTRSNQVAAPKSDEHPHAKPEPVLHHFFEMLVTPATRLLDPTCGSGTALRAALSLGADCVLGIEREATFADVGRRALARTERELELL